MANPDLISEPVRFAERVRFAKEYTVDVDRAFFDCCYQLGDRMRKDGVRSLPLRRRLLYVVLSCGSGLSDALIDHVASFAHFPGVVSDRNIHFLVRVAALLQHRFFSGCAFIQFDDVDKHFAMVSKTYRIITAHDDIILLRAGKLQYLEMMRLFGPIAKWDTSLVTNMRDLFFFVQVGRFDPQNFDICRMQHKDIDLSEWDVSNVRDMSWTFAGCCRLPDGLQQWNVDNVRWMVGTFFGCVDEERLRPNLFGWRFRASRVHLPNVEDARFMFAESVVSNRMSVGRRKWTLPHVPRKDYMYFSTFGKRSANLVDMWSLNVVFGDWKNDTEMPFIDMRFAIIAQLQKHCGVWTEVFARQFLTQFLQDAHAARQETVSRSDQAPLREEPKKQTKNQTKKRRSGRRN